MAFANGAELLGWLKLDKDGDYVILARVPNQYVTARMGQLTDNEWYWGHYFTMSDLGFSQAFEDLMRRAGKNLNPDK